MNNHNRSESAAMLLRMLLSPEMTKVENEQRIRDMHTLLNDQYVPDDLYAARTLINQDLDLMVQILTAEYEQAHATSRR